MLLAEDLLLLLTDDDSGRLVVSGSAVDVALGGAQLIELTLLGRVDVTGEGEGRAGRLVVRPGERPADPLLEEALAQPLAQPAYDCLRLLALTLRHDAERLLEQRVGRALAGAHD